MFANFLSSAEFADVCLKVSSIPEKSTSGTLLARNSSVDTADNVPLNVPFMLHRVVLASKSPFFSRLFSVNSSFDKDSARKLIQFQGQQLPCHVVAVPSMDSFYSVLMWIYSDKLHFALDTSFGVLRLAEEWMLQGLRETLLKELDVICTGAAGACIEIKHKIAHDLILNAMKWSPPSVLLHHLLSLVFSNNQDQIYMVMSAWLALQGEDDDPIKLTEKQQETLFGAFDLTKFSKGTLREAYNDGFINKEALTLAMFYVYDQPEVRPGSKEKQSSAGSKGSRTVSETKKPAKSSIRSIRSFSRISLKKVQFDPPTRPANEHLSASSTSSVSFPAAAAPRSVQVEVEEQVSEYYSYDESTSQGFMGRIMTKVTDALFPMQDMSTINENSILVQLKSDGSRTLSRSGSFHSLQIERKERLSDQESFVSAIDSADTSKKRKADDETSFDNRQLLTPSFLMEVESLEPLPVVDDSRTSDVTRNERSGNRGDASNDHLLSRTSELLSKIELSRAAIDALSQNMCKSLRRPTIVKRDEEKSMNQAVSIDLLVILTIQIAESERNKENFPKIQAGNVSPADTSVLLDDPTPRAITVPCVKEESVKEEKRPEPPEKSQSVEPSSFMKDPSQDLSSISRPGTQSNRGSLRVRQPLIGARPIYFDPNYAVHRGTIPYYNHGVGIHQQQLQQQQHHPMGFQYQQQQQQQHHHLNAPGMPVPVPIQRDEQVQQHYQLPESIYLRDSFMMRELSGFSQSIEEAPLSHQKSVSRAIVQAIKSPFKKRK